MFYRRKVILGLLQLFEGELEKIRLQKLLFLFSERQQEPTYEFVPYRYGCFSYSANADLKTMVKKGLLGESEESFTKIDRGSYLKKLNPLDLRRLYQIRSDYGNMSSESLMRHTYINFPYWAINSEVAERLLHPEQYDRVIHCRPNEEQRELFTIGYEGKSLEKYLNQLIRNNVSVLVDVRRNAVSMKFGFSQKTLRKYCESLNITYMHFPEVGIQSSQRQDLKSQDDYDKLFSEYKKEGLSKTESTQYDILDVLKKNRRIALTCFEANEHQCHRKHLAESMETLSCKDFSFRVTHL